MVCSVERISECYLIPVLELIVAAFPFEIKGFHGDNGSEFINRVVAGLLAKLYIEFTKSRPRHCNDDPLAVWLSGSTVDGSIPSFSATIRVALTCLAYFVGNS